MGLWSPAIGSLRALVHPGGNQIPARRTRGGFDKTNLMGWWSLDEASGNRADSHTNGLTLTDNNTVTQATGKVGSAGQFTAANSEYLNRASEAALQTGDIDFTFAVWVYRDSGGDRGIMGKFGGTREPFLFHTADRFRLYVSSDGNAGATETIVENGQAVSNATWYFVVGWHDATANTVNIQVNDNTPVSAAHSGGGFASTNDFLIGNIATLYWDGRIDEASFWKRVLTSDERTWLYNSGNGRAYTDL